MENVVRMLGKITASREGHTVVNDNVEDASDWVSAKSIAGAVDADAHAARKATTYGQILGIVERGAAKNVLRDDISGCCMKEP